MAKEKELGSFKVSEAVKKPVSPTSQAQMAKKKADAKPEAPSAGFPNIEGLIEGSTLDKSGLQSRMAALEEMTKKGDQKAKGSARKALLAYQHLEELLDYLWNTKVQLGQPQLENPAPSKSGGKSAAQSKGPTPAKGGAAGKGKK